jgi:hypothetical protein
MTQVENEGTARRPWLLARTASALLALSGLCFGWSAAVQWSSRVPLTDPGEPVFELLFAILHGVASIRLWRGDRSGLFSTGIVLAIWGALLIRRGTGFLLPIVPVLIATALALAAHRALVRTSGEPTVGRHVRQALYILVVVAAVAIAPIWKGHWGFAGGFHGHTVFVHNHFH